MLLNEITDQDPSDISVYQKISGLEISPFRKVGEESPGFSTYDKRKELTTGYSTDGLGHYSTTIGIDTDH
jgi:hypothetical protein